MSENRTPSPLEIPKSVEPVKMDFFTALREIISGKKVTKLDWNHLEYYGLVQDGSLRLHKPDGQFYDWILTLGDMSGTDYIIII